MMDLLLDIPKPVDDLLVSYHYDPINNYPTRPNKARTAATQKILNKVRIRNRARTRKIITRSLMR